MTDVTTTRVCDECGLAYRESLIPHQCAEWAKGRSSEQPANDFCNECSGYTHMPWCSEYVDPELKRQEDALLTTPTNCNEAERQRVSEQPASATGSEQSQLFPRYSFAVVTGRYKILDNRSGGPVRITQIATADGEQEARTIVDALNTDVRRAEELSSLLAGMTTERDWFKAQCENLQEEVRTTAIDARVAHEQNERLREALRQARGFISEATWTTTHPSVRQAAEDIVKSIDAALNHAEQGEGER